MYYPPVHIRWKRRVLRSNRQNGEPTCPHLGVDQPRTLTPVLTEYRDGKYPTVHRFGPGIRECCLNHGLALAAWWYGIQERRPEAPQRVLDQWDHWQRQLEKKVPYPSPEEQREYQLFRTETKRFPECALILGLAWPCHVDALRKRWRELAKKHHPDLGGNPEDFHRFKIAYEQAVQLTG